ncbi:OmpW/AlkL family protein [Rugamonas rubra]|jgi:outer membrane protein|uniref:Outer membrane protein n=1 Tax=Rugamonas rubra TaxID=758825 RepID=A0A1I4TV22_9BURK|nr:OmpW family outer membrane protein [Rugamonas rubra]SFM80539.1 outer membrane protein [Rugamonas rubra]
MKKPVAAMILATLGMVAGNALAEQSPWMVRVRLERLSPADKSDPVGGVGASDRISVSKKTIPDIDISYFFTPNISAELVLTYPQKHDVMLDGAKIGTFKHLPPTLLAQYHFMPEATFSPYLGVGVNYTNIHKVELLGGAGSLEHKSVGLALQAGADYKIDKNWSLNFDVKKIQIRSDVFAAGTKISNVQIDPWLVGVGVGYRF